MFKLSKSLPSTKALNCWLMNGVITESLSAHFFRQHDGSLPLMPQTLLGLKRYGLVSRTAKPTIPPRVDYAITILGRSLFDPIGAMAKWVVDKHPQIIKARRAFDAAR